MKVQCPHCQTEYDLDADLLEAAWFKVACSHCHRLFRADPGHAFLDEPGEPADDAEIERLVSEVEEALETPADEPSPRPSLPTAAMDHRVPPEMADLKAEELPREFLLHTPEIQPRQRHPLLGGLLVLLLALGLAAQYAWLERDSLLAHPQVRQLAERICPYLGCRVPAPQVPPRYSLLDSRFEPLGPRRYRLHLLVRNDGSDAAPPPVLRIRLDDQRGRLLARRTLEPGTYLADDGARRLAPGQTLELELTLATPAGEAAGYEVQLEEPLT